MHYGVRIEGNASVTNDQEEPYNMMLEGENDPDGMSSKKRVIWTINFKAKQRGKRAVNFCTRHFEQIVLKGDEILFRSPSYVQNLAY